MIDIRTEQLLPASKVPGYLESRGLGRRVNIKSVYRWMMHGTAGIRLESVRLGGVTITSVEALQRWVAARARTPTPMPQASARHGGGTSLPAPADVAARRAHTLRVLTESRLMPTPLDTAIQAAFPRQDTKRWANILFRAGYRTPEDVRSRSKEQLLAIPRLGPGGKTLVASLKDRIDAGAFGATDIDPAE